MAKSKAAQNGGHQIHATGAEAIEVAQAQHAGAKFEWHFGRLTKLGNYEIAGGRGVTVVWEEGTVSSHQGDISDDQWEILKLAFMTTGRIAILSDQQADAWMHDYRFLEAVR